MALDPRHLKVFHAVCRANSISGAARQLNTSQPAVSVTMVQLEQALGAKLFERGRSGITLTREGLLLRRRAEAHEALLTGAVREMSLLAADVEGPVIVGGTPGALATLLPEGVNVLRRSRPRVDVQVLERTDTALVDMLRSERIDLALVTTGIEAAPADLVDEDLLSDAFALIVGRGREALGPRARLNALPDLPWVLPEAVGAFRRQVDALFVATGAATPMDVIRCDSLLSTKALVAETGYVTILPLQVVAAELKMGVLRAIEIEGGFLRTVGVRRLRDRVLAPVAEDFVQALRTAHAKPAS